MQVGIRSCAFPDSNKGIDMEVNIKFQISNIKSTIENRTVSYSLGKAKTFRKGVEAGSCNRVTLFCELMHPAELWRRDFRNTVDVSYRTRIKSRDNHEPPVWVSGPGPLYITESQST